jgi:cytochrome b subunit of formate dehydrogenase
MNKTKLAIWVALALLAVLIVVGIYLFIQADAPDWSSRI